MGTIKRGVQYISVVLDLSNKKNEDVLSKEYEDYVKSSLVLSSVLEMLNLRCLLVSQVCMLSSYLNI